MVSSSVLSTGRLVIYEFEGEVTNTDGGADVDIIPGDRVSGHINIDPSGAAGCSATPEMGELYCLYDSAPSFEYWFTIDRLTPASSRTWLSRETLSESGFWLSDHLFSDGVCNPIVVAEELWCEDGFDVFCLDLDQVNCVPVTVEGVNCYASGIHLLDLANGWVIDGFDTHQPGPASIDGVEAGFTLSCIDFSTFESFWVQADLAKFELATTDALISDLIDLIGNLDLEPGVSKSLLAHLKLPLAGAYSNEKQSLSIMEVKTRPGCPTRHQVLAFLNEVKALTGKKIPCETARLLVTMATSILEQLDC